METAIRTKNLSKTFTGRRGQRVEALKDLNLEIIRGEVFGFLGPNGAGKSTTIKLLMGLIAPTNGSFSINGMEGESPAYRKMVGFLPENPSFYDYLTGEEFLAFVGGAFGMKAEDVSKESGRLLGLLDLHDDRKRPIRSYSKGMVQRLGLAQCLLHNPDLLILDEPMSGLDPFGRMLVRDLILDLKQKGKTVFMSTHILNDIETICDRVGIIVKGALKKALSIQDFMIKGVRGYHLIFNRISGNMLEYLESAGVRAETKENATSCILEQKDFTAVMSRILGDGGTDIQFIEPVRKGLEELFREIVHEG